MAKDGSARVIAPTAPEEADAKLMSLAARKQGWVRVPIEQRVRLLRDGIHGVMEVADEWVARACDAKGAAPDSPTAGEEWISGPMVTVRYLRVLAESLEQGGRPTPPSMRRGPGGRAIATVFPWTALDRILYPGVTAEVWLQRDRLPTQGRIYHEKRAKRFGPGRVGLVLGAGNIGSIPPTDTLYKLFAEDEVVLLKMNPVNEYLGPLLERALAGLVDGGWLEFAYGGPEVGEYLCRHERVETIHLTGSDRTHDSIVWGGTADERARRKAAGTPVVDKPVTSELGCVSPVIVAPGRWTAADLEFQARNVASMVVHNASFNCNAAKVLVLPSDWTLRETFLEALREALAAAPPRTAYYPGARERYDAFVERYPNAIPVGQSGPGIVPWTLLPGVPPEEDEYALCNEAFCGLIAEVRLPAGRTGDPATFLDHAVRFVNERVWGTLSCTLLVHGKTARALGGGLDRAVDSLRYGGVGINIWPGILFGLGVTTWGAYPGHALDEIGSGRGVVHNSLLFDHPEKSVARAPFRMFPKPPWFADHRNALAVGRKIARFEASPSVAGLPSLFASALLG